MGEHSGASPRAGAPTPCEHSQGGWSIAAFSVLRESDDDWNRKEDTMNVEKVTRVSGEVVWRVRWRQHGRNRARAFSTRAMPATSMLRCERRAGSSQRST